MKSALLPILSLALATSWSAIAGTPVTSEKSVVIPAAPPAQDEWYLTVAAYLWTSAVDGTTGVGTTSISADTSIKDVLEELDFGYMGYFELGKGRWSLGVDVIYAELSDGSTFAVGPVRGSADFEQQQAWITARLQYTVCKTDRHKFDVFVGFRWTYFDIDIDVNTNLGPGVTLGLTRDWFDPIVGFRSVCDLNDKWFVQVMGDIGGFGVESDLTWQALAGLGYRFTPKLNGLIGYRALGVDYEKDGFKLDTTSYGPIIGLSYTF